MQYRCTQCGAIMPTDTKQCFECVAKSNDPLGMFAATANQPDNDSRRQANPSENMVDDKMAQQTVPGLWAALCHPTMRGKILKTGGLAVAKSLGLSGLVLLPGLLLTFVSPMVGVLWMFVGSFGLMVRTYARPWRLNWFTILLPAITAVTLALVQLFVFRNQLPSFSLLLGGCSIGLVIGLLRARSHTVYFEATQVMAKRTSGYLIVWAICFGATQMLGMYGRTLPLVRGSLIGSVMSTTMVICVSLLIFNHYLSLSRGAVPGESV